MYPIDIKKGKTNVIVQLLGYEGKVHQSPCLFKKTEKEFKTVYGFSLMGAPIVFKKDNILWKLSVTTGIFKGRKWESAVYLPIVDVDQYFDRLKK